MTYLSEHASGQASATAMAYPNVEIIREARRVVVHEYRFGGPPAHVSEGALEYMAGDGGLLRALTDLEAVLEECAWEHRRSSPVRALFGMLWMSIGMLFSQIGRPTGKGFSG